MAEWINKDGLRVRFGTDEASVVRGGELPPAGTFKEIEFVIDLAATPVNSALIPNTQGIQFAAGSFISEVLVINEVAATGTNAVLNVGLVRLDTTTVYDVDAFLSAAPRTDWDVAGEEKLYTIGVTGVGSAVGTTLANPGTLVYDYDTAAFTAGRIKIVIRFYVPIPAITNA